MSWSSAYFMAALYSRMRTYIFSSCGFFFLLLLFPRLILAVGHWMSTILSTILPHTVWPINYYFAWFILSDVFLYVVQYSFHSIASCCSASMIIKFRSIASKFKQQRLSTAFGKPTATPCVSGDYLFGTQISTRRLIARQTNMSTVVAAAPVTAVGFHQLPRVTSRTTVGNILKKSRHGYRW